jgi:hypothetical protein
MIKLIKNMKRTIGKAEKTKGIAFLKYLLKKGTKAAKTKPESTANII